MLRTLLLILTLFATGCKCPKKATATGGDAQTKAVLTRILSDTYGGSAEEELKVFRSEGELKKFFLQVNKTRKPGLTIPDVDFEREMVIVYSPGKTRGSAIPELEIRPGKNKETLSMAKINSAPEDPISNTDAITMPFIIYTMPRSELRIVLAGQE